MTKGAADRSLKSLNMKWLVMLAGLDIVVVLVFLAPELISGASWGTVAVARSLATALLPVVVLLLTGVLSHQVKATLVYWRLKDPYPGCEAFTKHGPADARIDMAALKKNVGELPTERAAQNSKWFKLYLKVENEVSVLEAHKAYLLFRDMAAMSLLLAALVPVALYFTRATASVVLASAIWFAVQFLVCCLGARNSGTRFVSNVLAIHSTKKIAGAATKPVAVSAKA